MCARILSTSTCCSCRCSIDATTKFFSRLGLFIGLNLAVGFKLWMDVLVNVDAHDLNVKTCANSEYPHTIQSKRFFFF